MDSRKEYLERVYGESQQTKLLARYRARESNHWASRLRLGEDLLDVYGAWCRENRVSEPHHILDAGCAIGTFAIEFAKKGYQCCGIDISPDAIRIANQLAAEEGVPEARFFYGDIKNWRFPGDEGSEDVDAIFAMDLIEHLHDHEMEEMLRSFAGYLKKGGAFVFHTFPTRYEPIFFNRSKPYLSHILVPFRRLPKNVFSYVLESWFLVLNMLHFFKHGNIYLNEIKNRGHCNPTTAQRLEKIFQRCGYQVVKMETGNMYRGLSSSWEPFYSKFDNQPDAHRHIWGVAVRYNQ